MSLANNSLCDIPYTGPNCTTTFAEYLGATYTGINAVILTIFCIEFLLLASQSYLITKKHGFSLHLDHSVLYLITMMAFFGIIRNIDSQSWRGYYPLWLTALFYDLGTCPAFTCWLIVVHSWGQFVFRAVFRTKKTTPRILKAVFYGSVTYVWLSQLIITTLTYAVGPLWKWKIVRYSVSGWLFFVWAIGGIYLGYIIHSVLKDAQKRYESNSSEPSSTNTTVSMATTNSNGSATNHNIAKRTVSTGNAISSKKRRAAIVRIFRMNFFALICETLVMFGLIYSAISYASTEYNASPPNVSPTPAGFSDFLFEQIFDIVHLLLGGFAFYFFRVDRNKIDDKSHGNAAAEESSEPTEGSIVDEEQGEETTVENEGAAGGPDTPASRAASIKRSSSSKNSTKTKRSASTRKQPPASLGPSSLDQKSSQMWLPNQAPQ